MLELEPVGTGIGASISDGGDSIILTCARGAHLHVAVPDRPASIQFQSWVSKFTLKYANLHQVDARSFGTGIGAIGMQRPQVLSANDNHFFQHGSWFDLPKKTGQKKNW